MKNKKLLSTILAATLAATTMAMPVMAADVSGDVPVDLGVRSGVLRVQLPTRLGVEIDQYQLAQTGDGSSQIYSQEFSMINKSNINVKVEVNSTVGVKSTIKLASTKEGAVKSGDVHSAWLAVAAATDVSGDVFSYDDLTTKSGDAPLVENYAQLKETNANVTTFAKSGDAAISGDAKQTFYLQAASGDARANIIYEKVTSGDVADVKPLAKFYKLDQEISGDAAVKAQLKNSDVYVISGSTVTKYAKGSTFTSLASGEKAYTIEDTATTDLDAIGSSNDTYIYGAANDAVKAGKAAFQYIGKLSEGKKWDKNDITGYTIKYTIDGIGASEYEEATKDGKCVQGFSSGAKSYVSAKTITATKNSVTLSLPTGVTLSKVELVHADGTAPITLTNGNQYTLNGKTFSVGASNIPNWLKASPAYNKIKLTYSDKMSETITLQ